MTPEEKISETFHKRSAISDICDEMLAKLDAEIAVTVDSILALQAKENELAGRRADVQDLRSKHNHPKIVLIAEVIEEKLRREQVGSFAVLPQDVQIESEVTFTTIDPPPRIKGTVLKDALDRGLEGSAFDPAFDPAPLAETQVEERAPFERVDIGSLDDERPTDEQVEEAEAEESPDVAFYREGAEDERMAAHPGDKKAASVSAILGKTKARDRGKLWRKIVQSAGETDIAQFNRYTVATALCFSNRTLNDALEGFVAQGNIEMLEHDDESWVKMRILRR